MKKLERIFLFKWLCGNHVFFIEIEVFCNKINLLVLGLVFLFSLEITATYF
jgi:hypothetical protein